MFELTPEATEATATILSAGGIGYAILRGANAIAKAASTVSAYIEKLEDALKQEREHREAERDHWQRVEVISALREAGEVLQ